MPVGKRIDGMKNTDLLNQDNLRKSDPLKSGPLTINVFTYGIRVTGQVLSADVVFDCRCLRNPHKEAKGKTGYDDAVRAMVRQSPSYDQHLQSTFKAIVGKLSEGTRTVSVGVFCTWGIHRSVAFALDLRDQLEAAGYYVELRHL